MSVSSVTTNSSHGLRSSARSALLLKSLDAHEADLEAEIAKRGLIPPTSTPEEDAKRAACMADATYFIDTYCMVQSDSGAGIVPFHLFDYQRDLLATLAQHREVIVLKARQLGITELVAAYAVWTSLTPYRTVVAISQGGLEAGELIRKARTCWEHLPDFLRVPLKNPRLLSTLEYTNGSRILPQPATERAGRSFNAQLLILDEWAQQQFADAIYAAAAPTALSAGNQIIGISTAAGVGNLFHTQWLLAEEGRGMHPVFLPWSVRPGRDADWYARTTRTMDAAKIAQEYPTQAAEAFLLSGRPVFDTAALTAIAATCEQPLEIIPHGTDVHGRALGHERIWAHPTPGRRYVCGADTAEGLAKGDYSAAIILDWETGLDVAELHGHWPPEEFAHLLSLLCARYNHALLAVERNNHGHAVLLALTSIEHYTPLYRHKEYDKQHQRVIDLPPGWNTSPKSKPIMIDSLGAAIREPRPYRSILFLAEARTYTYLDNGGMGASGALFDDRVVAYAIAEQMRAYEVPMFGALDADAADALRNYRGF